MPNSEAYKIAKMQSKVDRERLQLETLKTVLFNPVVELIGGVTILEYQARHGNINQVAAGLSLAALYGIIGVQVLSPLIPVINEGNKNVLEAAGKLTPLLLAAAA